MYTKGYYETKRAQGEFFISTITKIIITFRNKDYVINNNVLYTLQVWMCIPLLNILTEKQMDW